jgi:hypothetical protein
LRHVDLMLRWSNHPWFISIAGGLIATLIVAVVGFVFSPFFNSALPTVGTPPPSPKTIIEVRAHSFKLPGVDAGILSSFFVQLERELTIKYVTENKMNETEAKSEAHKFMDSIYKIKLLKNIFEAADAGGYNSVFIENKGPADDKNVVLFIDGIRFVADIENKFPNVQRENDLITIKLIRPGDEIYLQIWTRETLFKADSKRVRASSDAGVIPVSMH